MIDKMTTIEILLDWLGKNHYYIGNDLLDKVEELKQMEKLKNHSEYMRGWYNGFNSKEIESKQHRHIDTINDLVKNKSNRKNNNGRKADCY